MRNLTAGNKVNFTIFTIIVVIIIIILIVAVSMVVNTEKEEYTVSSATCIYDKNYDYIELENDGTIQKKWTGNYYLEENETGNEYQLGDYAIAFDKNKKSIDLFGTFYQVLEGGDVSKLTKYNTVKDSSESRFYKIDDRKYLIIADSIVNDTGSLSTSNYLIVIVDKLGNALLLNNEINVKTIKEMILNTDSFSFDVANETLEFGDETIDLAKILGSTNEYVQSEEEEETENETEEDETTEEAEVATTITSTTTTETTETTDTSSTMIIQTGEDGNNESSENNNESSENTENSSNTSSSSTTFDTSWVATLNAWIEDVAAGFKSIYNSNSNSSDDDSSLSKSIALNSLDAGTTYIDINYTITDPESKYNVVYATVTDGTDTYTISLDKSATTYRLTGLNPNTTYSVEIGYKIIYSDSKVDEEVEDSMTVKTTSPVESLEITKVTLTKIYYKLTLDSDFVYDSGVTIGVYLSDNKYSTISLTDSNLEKAAASSYTGSFAIPEGYETTGAYITIKLENTNYGGTAVDTGLSAKIVNY